jgi:ATP-dependent helicase/nuclease subunit B
MVDMFSTQTQTLSPFCWANNACGFWDAAVAHTQTWAQARHLNLRDAVVVLPQTAWLPLARSAWARAGGWMPRIETPHTLAISLGPNPLPPAGQVCFDAAMDQLNAAALLRSQPWGAAWAQRDAASFEHATRRLVSTAHALLRASVALPPSQRATYWDAARATFHPSAGPDATERALARVAIEWAALAPPPATDRLFAATPSAWITVQAGGADAFITQLLAHANAPCYILSADAPVDHPFSAVHSQPCVAVCDGFEDEAQCTAAQVLVHVQRGDVPVALIAQDRLLVRRVRALLERAGASLADASGWTLSTTRAAAQVMSLLRAAQAEATTDALLDSLKNGLPDHAQGVVALEAWCRKHGLARIAALHQTDLPAAAHAVWQTACAGLRCLSAHKNQPLAQWLAALAAALSAWGSLEKLQLDSAGQQLINTLHLHAPPAGADALVMNLAEFQTWVDAVLEQATFLPHSTDSGPAQVVITPLAHAVLQPFAAVVFPGADDAHLGGAPLSASLLSDAQAQALGVTTAAQHRTAQLQAFAHVLAAAPHITLLRRRAEAGQPLAPSPLLERLSLAMPLQPWVDPRLERQLAPTPIRLTAPSASPLMPHRLSASACEALRACPYRFFALNLLRLREDDELERDVEKRDYGTWLHAVLLQFHAARKVGSVELEVAQLLQAAQQQQTAQGLSESDFLPFNASFQTLAPRYVAWLHNQDADASHWLRGEAEFTAQPPELGGVELYGVIDRLDDVRRGSGLKLVDYKTGSASSLKDKVKNPFEDTQLAFYAALVGSHTEKPLTASYLALDGPQGIEEIPHPEVETSARALINGLANDLTRLRAGSGLPALGAGSACDYCAARGVCRRDHWSV